MPLSMRSTLTGDRGRASICVQEEGQRAPSMYFLNRRGEAG